MVQDDLGFVFFGECFLRDLVGSLDELPQHRLAAHDFRVVRDVGGVWQTVGQVSDETDPADGFERILFFQFFADENRIDLRAAFEKRDHREEDATMRRHVEIFRAELFDCLADQAVIEQDRTENGAFGFSTVWESPFEGLFANRIWTGHKKKRCTSYLTCSVNNEQWIFFRKP